MPMLPPSLTNGGVAIAQTAAGTGAAARGSSTVAAAGSGTVSRSRSVVKSSAVGAGASLTMPPLPNQGDSGVDSPSSIERSATKSLASLAATGTRRGSAPGTPPSRDTAATSTAIGQGGTDQVMSSNPTVIIGPHTRLIGNPNAYVDATPSCGARERIQNTLHHETIVDVVPETRRKRPSTRPKLFDPTVDTSNKTLRTNSELTAITVNSSCASLSLMASTSSLAEETPAPSDEATFTTSTANRRHAVQFAPMATYHTIEPRNLKEHGHLWHSDDERQANDEHTKDTIRRFRSLVRRRKEASTPDEQSQILQELDQVNIRGIEHFATRSAWQEQRQEQLAVIQGVLKTQEEQRAAAAAAGADAKADPIVDNEDAMDLALVSASLSFQARKRALVYGLQDAEEA